jgi:biotin carboxyl carrier protein
MSEIKDRYIVTIGDREFDIELTPQDNDFLLKFNGSSYNVAVDQLASNKFLFKVNDGSSEVNISRNGSGLEVFIDGKVMNVRVEPYSLAELRKKAGMAADGPEDKIIKAPMPGMVLSISVKPGDKVTKGTTLLFIEAMKMENMIKAPYDGVVREIFIDVGQAVDKNDNLVELE